MANPERLTICQIGCGSMGRLHAQNLVVDPRISRLMLCDTDVMRAEALRQELGPRGPDISIATPDAAFDLPHPDAYLIVSPAAEHLGQLARAAPTGAYVFCEKPVAAAYADIVPFAKMLKPHADRIQIGFNRRFDPHLAAFKARLDTGAVGPIEQLHLVSRDHTPPTLEQLPFSAGLIAETMIHDFDTVRWLLDDEIASVFCRGAALINPVYADHDHIDTATTVLTGASGQQVVIQNSWRSPNGYDQRIEAMGSLGRLNVSNPRDDLVVTHTRAGQQTAPISDDWSTRYVTSYRIEMQRFIDCVAEARAVTPTLTDGIAASYLSDRCIEALKTGLPQSLQTV